MKFSSCRRIFHFAASAVVTVAAAGAITGCMSAGSENAVPAAALTQPSAPAPALAASGPRVTGQYPNLNITPQVAADQISEEQRQALVQDLAARRDSTGAAVPAGGATPDAQSLRRLAQSHGEARLQQIESSE